MLAVACEWRQQSGNVDMRRLLKRAFVGAAFCLIAAEATFADPLPRSRSEQPARHDIRKAVPCPEYGPGFMRLAGSSTCVKVGGKVEFEMSTRPGRNTLQSR